MPTIPINPIIPGFAPDPSLVRVGRDYFLVNSTFHLFPGLPIYTSKDLVHWEHIGNALHRQSQMSLEHSSTKINPDLLATGGLFAPTIRYHNETFYIVCTNIIHKPDIPGRAENFVISTKDIWSGEWSDPVYFDHDGIDPSLFFDDDGKVYLQGSHTVRPRVTEINLFEIDLTTGKRLSEEKNIWGGTGGKFPEGPHIYKRNGWYYVLIAEGGTHEGHMITTARSKDIWGPYEPCPSNPILTAAGTQEYIQYVGHCEAFTDSDGNSWGVCLGVRMEKGGRYIMGRETFLTSGEWKEGEWPAFDTVKMDPKGVVASQEEGKPRLSARPGVDFLHIRNPELSNYSYSGTDKAVTITSVSSDLSHPNESPSFIGKRMRYLDGTSSVTIFSPPEGSKVKAGLAVYKDEHRYLRIFLDTSESRIGFELVNGYQKLSKSDSKPVEQATEYHFTIEHTEKEFRLSYSTGEGSSKTTIAVVDTLEMTDPDFVGPVIGAFLVDQGEPVKVDFTNLELA